MTNIDALLETLRDLADKGYAYPRKDILAILDHVAAQTATIAEQALANVALGKRLAEAEMVVNSLRAASADSSAQLKAQQDRGEAAEARARELEAALRPFAFIGELRLEDHHKDTDGLSCVAVARDLRRAVQLLATDKEEGATEQTVKYPVMCSGLDTEWLRGEKSALPASADCVRLRFDTDQITLDWPDRADEARMISKMVRSAYEAGHAAKAAQILDVLGVPREALI